MTYGAPPGWYPDPWGSGGQRYFDGVNWTSWAPPGYGGYSVPRTWKGARLGFPPSGPGSLANPGIRLVARLIDYALFLPLYIGIEVVFVVYFVNNISTLPQATPSDPNPTVTPQQFNHFFGGLVVFWLVSVVVIPLVMVLYEGLMTAHFGQTLGKKWMKIRPATPDGARLTTGRSFGRVGAVFVAGFASILDPLWCLWDDSSQCLHDKIAGTVVVTER